MGLLEADIVVLAQPGHKLHTSVPEPRHTAILVMAAINHLEATDHLLCHPDHPYGPIVVVYSSDHNCFTAVDIAVGVVSLGTKGIVSSDVLAHHTTTGVQASGPRLLYYLSPNTTSLLPSTLALPLSKPLPLRLILE